MCAGAIAHARIARLYFGASDPKSGGVTVGRACLIMRNRIIVPRSMMESERMNLGALLRAFFQGKRH